MRKLTYSIKTVGPTSAEVHAHGVKYVLEADKSGMALAASKGSVKEYAMRRWKKNVVEVDIADRNGRQLMLKTTINAREVRTEVMLGKRRYRIKSLAGSHPAQVARALRGTPGPDVRFIRWFMKDLQHYEEFRQDVRIRLPGLSVLNGGPETYFCVIMCACCAFTPVDGPISAPCCVACLTCMLE